MLDKPYKSYYFFRLVRNHKFLFNFHEEKVKIDITSNFNVFHFNNK